MATPGRKPAPALAENEEIKYKQKCKDLRKRIVEIEEYNETTALSIERTKRAVKRLRVERAILLEKVEDKTLLQVDDSDGTPSPPASPVANEALKRRELSPSMTNPGAGGGGAIGDSPPPVLAPPQPTKTKKGPARDPNLPKRPQNRYRIFCEDQKENIKQRMEAKFPGESFDLNRAMADSWKELTSEGRKKYNEMYDDARAKHVKEMAEYASNNPDIDPKEMRAAQKMYKDLAEKNYPMENPFNNGSMVPSSPPQQNDNEDDNEGEGEDGDDEEKDDKETAGEVSSKVAGKAVDEVAGEVVDEVAEEVAEEAVQEEPEEPEEPVEPEVAEAAEEAEEAEEPVEPVEPKQEAEAEAENDGDEEMPDAK